MGVFGFLFGVGTSGDDNLQGTSGNDIIAGGKGDDTISGKGGDDILIGGSGDDTIKGGSGNDLLLGGSGDDTLKGGSGDDLLLGGSGDDKLNGGSGDDLLLGGSGDDKLTGGAGDDIVLGGSGDDILRYVVSKNVGDSDWYDGGSGFDKLKLILTSDEWAQADIQQDIQNYIDFLRTGSNSVFQFSAFDLAIRRVERLEVIVDGQSLNIIVTEPGETTTVDLSGSTNDEAIQTIGDGDTEITTGDGNDIVVTGNGSNTIDVGDGNNTVTTGSGDDVVTAGDGDNTIDVGDGNNQVTTGSGADIITAGAGDDNIQSGAGDDTVAIGDGDDIVDTGVGDDTIIAGAGGGDDVIDGSGGNDTVTYPSTSLGVTIDLNAFDRSATAAAGGGTVGDLLVNAGYSATLPVGLATGGEIGTDVLIDIENATGGAGADTITGNASANVLVGAGGDDVINGGDGDDFLEPGDGDDTVDGGAGIDIVFYDRTDPATAAIVFTGGTGLNGIAVGDAVVTGVSVGTDTFTNVEGYGGSPFDDTFIGGDANEGLGGGGGDDLLDGGEGSDFFVPNVGNDTVIGGLDVAGDDFDIVTYSFAPDNAASSITYTGGTGINGIAVGDAVVVGAATGTDTLTGIEQTIGSDFDDTFNGGDAAEDLIGGLGDDFMDGGAGDDRLDGGDGNDTILGGLGADNILGGADNDTLDGGDGSDFFHPGSGDDTIDGGADVGAPDEDIVFYGFDDPSPSAITYTGGTGVNGIAVGDAVVTGVDAGTDTLTRIEGVGGTGFDDTFIGGDADEGMGGGFGNDTFDGGEGSDLILPGAGDDTVDGGVDAAGDDIDVAHYSFVFDVAPDPITYTGGTGTNGIAVGDAVVTGSYAGTDTLTRIEQVVGTDFGDTFIGGDANEQLVGAGGDDVINGGDGDDFLEPGDGDDTVDGGAGIDIVFYDRTDPATAAIVFTGGTGLNGIAVGDAVVTGVSVGTDTFTNVEGYGGSPFDDTFIGGDANEGLGGGGGDDLLDGGEGSDFFVPNVGNDTVIGGLDVAGDDFDIVTYSFAPDNAASSITYTGGTGINGIAVGDAVVVGAATGTDTLTGIEQTIGSDFDDTFNGGDAAEDLIGGLGDDFMDGGAGDDRLDGGDGNDTILGGLGADTIFDGDGNDTVDGGEGADLIFVGRGDDVIDGGVDAAGDDLDVATYVFEPTSSITYTGGTGTNGIAVGDGVVTGATVGTDTLTRIEGVGGTNFDDTFIGGDADEGFGSLGGNDNVDGGEGSDIFLPGTGDDTIDGGVDAAGDDIDVVEYNNALDPATAAIVYTGGTGLNGIAVGDAVVTGTTVGTDTLTRIEQVVGTDFGDTFNGGDANEQLVGAGGDDVINGGDGDDFLEPGDGDDTVDGGAGIDIVFYDRTDPATAAIVFTGGTGLNGIAVGDAVVTGVSVGTDTFTNVEGYGGSPFDDTFIGGDANEGLGGGGGDDLLDGGEGSDFFVPNVGNDTVIGGLDVAGDDFDIVTYSFAPDNAASSITYTGGTGINGIAVGDAVVVGAATGTDTLTGIEQTIGSDFDDTFNGGDADELLVGALGDDVINGGGGNDTLFGDAGHDTLDGVIGDDTLIGGAGDDTLFGNDGADILRPGSGNDTVDGGIGDDFVAYAFFDGATDGISLVGGTGTNGIAVGDAVITGNASIGTDTITNVSGFIATEFNDVLNGGDAAENIDGLDGNDIINGGGGDDFLLPGSGDDQVDGGAGANDQVNYNFSNPTSGFTYTGGTGTNGIAIGDATIVGDASIGSDDLSNVEIIDGTDFVDTLMGGAADETFFGFDGNDTLAGGGGNDYLQGDGGADTFIYDGVGDDIVADFSGITGGELDVIDLSGIAGLNTFADVQAVMTQVGTTVVLDFGGGNELDIQNVLIADLQSGDFIV